MGNNGQWLAGNPVMVNVAIAGGTALSGAADIEGFQLMTIQMPAEWDTANLTFLAAATAGGTYQDVYDGGAEYVFPVVAGKCCVDADNILALAPLRYIRLRSGTASAPVSQTADRVLTLLLKR